MYTPVRLDWTSGTLKILGIFFGSGNVEELNWRPRIVAVKNVLNSWRKRGLSYRGKSLIVNALALAQIWYVASLIDLPAWALRELVSLVFSFFWKGKPDLVARKVVCQPTSLSGFGVVSIELKACALLVQWIRRLVTKPASWVHFFYYYCWHRFGCSPLDVLSRPSSLDLSLLPPFYNSTRCLAEGEWGFFEQVWHLGYMRFWWSLSTGCFVGIYQSRVFLHFVRRPRNPTLCRKVRSSVWPFVLVLYLEATLFLRS